MKLCNKNIKGTYLLLLKNNISREITVGKLGNIFFKKGYYIYSGSAFGPGGLKSRLNRHIAKDKKMHWHIDYIRQQMDLSDIHFSETEDNCECQWIKSILAIPGTSIVNNLGSSDCRCKSHFIFIPGRSVFKKLKTNLS